MYKIFGLTLALFFSTFIYAFAQNDEKSTMPAGYQSRYYLNDPLPNLEVMCIPNPTYDTAVFEYDLKQAGEISLRIYNTMGHKIDEPLKAFKEAGNYSINWSPKELNLKGGLYYARVGYGDEYRIIKVRYIR